MRSPLSASLTIALVFLPNMALARTDVSFHRKSPTLLHQEVEKRERQMCRSCTIKPTRSEQRAQSYTNATYGFSVQLPEGWTTVEDDTAYLSALRVMYLLPEGSTRDTTTEAISIVVEQPAPSNLETYLVNASWWLKDSLPGFVPSQVDALSIRGMKAYSLVFTAGTEANPVKAKEVFIIQNDTTYILALWTTPERYDALVPTFDAMAASFSGSSR